MVGSQQGRAAATDWPRSCGEVLGDCGCRGCHMLHVVICCHVPFWSTSCEGEFLHFFFFTFFAGVPALGWRLAVVEVQIVHVPNASATRCTSQVSLSGTCWSSLISFRYLLVIVCHHSESLLSYYWYHWYHSNTSFLRSRPFRKLEPAKRYIPSASGLHTALWYRRATGKEPPGTSCCHSLASQLARHGLVRKCHDLATWPKNWDHGNCVPHCATMSLQSYMFIPYQDNIHLYYLYPNFARHRTCSNMFKHLSGCPRRVETCPLSHCLAVVEVQFVQPLTTSPRGRWRLWHWWHWWHYSREWLVPVTQLQFHLQPDQITA